MADIEPAFSPLISICRELPTPAGYLDNLWLTPAGGIVIGECKLFRNPQARREVVAQALDYARAMSGWHYEDLQDEFRKAVKQPAATIWDLIKDHTDLDEGQFVDAVERRLQTGRILALIIGDGIQEGVEALTAHLQLHAGLHTGLALVDLSIWQGLDGVLVVPRIPMKTRLIERGIVVIAPDTPAKIEPPVGATSKASPSVVRTARSMTASEPEFYEQLTARRPELPNRLRAFLDSLGAMGITGQFGKTLALTWTPEADVTLSAGYIDNYGRLWSSVAWTAANRAGVVSAAEKYQAGLVNLVGGQLRQYERSAPEVLGANGKGVDLLFLLDHAEQWKALLGQFMADAGV